LSAESLDAFLQKVYDRYNVNPSGWKVFIGKDDKGYPTMLFFSQDEVWELKLDSFYKPEPLWVGTNLTGFEDKVLKKFKTPDYGFRPMDENKVKNIIELLSKRKTYPRKVMNRIMDIKPTSLNEIGPQKMVLHGPVIHSAQLPIISEKQIDLDIKLRSELQRMLSNRGILSMYS
jgi:hypothetical protein